MCRNQAIIVGGIALALAATSARADGVLRIAGTRLPVQYSAERSHTFISNFGHGLIAETTVDAALSADDATGVTVSWEQRLGSRWGVAIELGSTSVPINYSWNAHITSFFPPDQPPSTRQESGSGRFASLRVEPVFLDLRYHLVEGPRWDLYAGVSVGQLRVGDFEPAAGVFPATFPGEQELGDAVEDGDLWGVLVGLDVPLGSRSRGLRATLLVRAFDGAVEVTTLGGREDLDFGAVVGAIGLGWRF